MALNKTSMAQMRIQEMAAAYPDTPLSGEIYDEMLKYYEADSAGIIEDIQADAVVQPGTMSNSGGPLSGTGKVM